MKQKPLILISLLLAAFVINLDITIVNVALPTLVRELHASNSQLQWVVDAYSLVFASLLLAAGSLSDRLGRKGFLLVGLAVFGLASVAGGLTSTPGQLIVARCFMGLGAAMIFPATLSLISNVFTERGERARAIGLWGATIGAAVALGPIVGGWLLEQFRWTSIFFAMAPVAAVGAALVAWSVPTSRDPSAGKTDIPGLVLSSAAMALLIYTIIEAPAHGWSSARSLGGFALAAAVFAIFVARERTTSEPMVDLSLFRNLRFTAASGSVTVAFFAIAGFSFLITQYFQFFKGYRPLSTGVHLLPVAFSVAIASVLGTKLAVRVGTKQVVTAGLFSLAGFFAWVATARTGTSYLEIAGQMVLGGSGVGLVSAPATEAIMGVVPKAKAGVGSAVNDSTRLLGSTLGVAIIGSVYASLYNTRLTNLLPGELTPRLARAAHDSVGAALGLANRASLNGHPALGHAVHAAASNAFFHGFSAGCLVAAGVSGVAAIAALRLLPAHPVAPIAATAPIDGRVALGEEG
ncbi:MAG TPA: MFS transporter [Solirubrobacteraceae bacterium]|nr:MFS transporter [Solirubrobacteraceae bacterium]